MASCEAFLEAWRLGRAGCLVVDAYLPELSGLELLQQLNETGHRLPAIMITGHGDVPIAVQAMKAGTSDFIEKPVSRDELLTSIALALEQSRDSNKLSEWRADAAKRVASLTQQQRRSATTIWFGAR
jgi:two-component system, chemotaxis family, CheB/CheR fusion protein